MELYKITLNESKLTEEQLDDINGIQYIPEFIVLANSEEEARELAQQENEARCEKRVDRILGSSILEDKCWDIEIVKLDTPKIISADFFFNEYYGC